MGTLYNYLRLNATMVEVILGKKNDLAEGTGMGKAAVQGDLEHV